MTLMPAEANSGIVFRRTDIAGGGALVAASWDAVVDTTMCTTVGNDDGLRVGTIEHLMAALAGCGIDNAVIEIDGPEVPIMDGSAAPFVFLIECAGVLSQAVPRRVIKVLKPVRVGNSERFAELSPADEFSVEFEIDFDNSAISRQVISLGMGDGAFKKELADARTFGFLHEVEQLRAAGLARGGSLDNAIVVSGDKVLNEDGLRHNDEFVRHKVLDAIGDLYLAGAPIKGLFSGLCSGHAANNGLLHALFADPTAWTYEPMAVESVGGPVRSALQQSQPIAVSA